ncbi:MAG: DUF4097 family beta strand repeat-containing protein [Pyrinomonadaceae bacterium]
MKRIAEKVLATAVVLVFGVATGFASGFCGGGDWNDGGRKSVYDLRDMTIPTNGEVAVDSQKNGGIEVIGENRSDVRVEACVQAWADSETEASALVKSVNIQTDGLITAATTGEEKNFSVSYKVHVPNDTSLRLKAHNGGLRVSGVTGNMNLETHNGGIKLSGVGGSVVGRTTNGGISISLDGAVWNGDKINVQTTNGGVRLELPSNFAGNFELGTVNGGFSSDFEELSPAKDDSKGWKRNKKVTASLNGGGATVRAVTVNGGVKISRL